MESTFLVSKGLLSLYDKENNAWLLVDAYFSSRVQLDISLAHCEMSKAGQNYSMLIGWDRGHCFLITRALLVIDSGNFRKTLQIREKAIALGPCDYIYKASHDTTNALHKKQRRNGK